MPILTAPFVSTEAAIYNDIYFGIIKDLAHILELDKDVEIVMKNSLNVSKVNLRNTVNNDVDVNTPITIAAKKLLINIDDDFDENSAGVGFNNRMDAFPIFRDTDIGVSIAPIYYNCNFIFKFIYKSASKIDIENLRNRIKYLLNRSKNLFMHKVQYSMILPDRVTNLVKDVYEMKDRLYPISFEHYLRDNATNRLHLLTDMSNLDNTRFAIKEIQEDVIGEFGFIGIPPEKDEDNSTGQYSLAFSYGIQLEVPRIITSYYPVMVCNQIMKDEYITPIEHTEEKIQNKAEFRNPHLGRAMTALYDTEPVIGNDNINPRLFHLRLPIWDVYDPPTNVIGYGTAITALTIVDEDDKRTLMDLKDFSDEYYFEPEMLEYIRARRKVITQPYHTLLYFGLDQLDRHFSNDCLELTEDLILKAKAPLDLIRPCRVVVSIASEINVLPEYLILELKQDRFAFRFFMSEYLRSKNTYRLNYGPEEIHAREITLIQIFFYKFQTLLTQKKYDELREVIEILNIDTDTSIRVGRYIYKSFYNLSERLYNERICYLGGVYEVIAFSSNPERLVKELEDADNYRYGRIKREDEFNLGTDVINLRGLASPFLQKTVMKNNVFTVRRRD